MSTSISSLSQAYDLIDKHTDLLGTIAYSNVQLSKLQNKSTILNRNLIEARQKVASYESSVRRDKQRGRHERDRQNLSDTQLALDALTLENNGVALDRNQTHDARELLKEERDNFNVQIDKAEFKRHQKSITTVQEKIDGYKSSIEAQEKIIADNEAINPEAEQLKVSRENLLAKKSLGEKVVDSLKSMEAKLSTAKGMATKRATKVEEATAALNGFNRALSEQEAELSKLNSYTSQLKLAFINHLATTELKAYTAASSEAMRALQKLMQLHKASNNTSTIFMAGKNWKAQLPALKGMEVPFNLSSYSQVAMLDVFE